LRRELTNETLSSIVEDFDNCLIILDRIPETSFAAVATQWENFMIRSINVCNAITNSGAGLPKSIARDFLQRNIQVEKKFHQVCPEIVFKSHKPENSFSILFYVLVDLKEYKSAMHCIADCLVSTTPIGGKKVCCMHVLFQSIAFHSWITPKIVTLKKCSKYPYFQFSPTKDFK